MNRNSAASLVSQIWPAAGGVSSALRAILLAIAGTLVLWASAKIQVPFWPVPATLQTLAVVMIGALYGSRLGAATVAAYLAEGAAGLPVFAGTPEKGIGFAYMAGPTGGYLLGFFLAAFLIGQIVESGLARSLPAIALSVVASHGVVHVFGLVWLSSFIGVSKAVAAGYTPFILSDLVKIALSTMLIFAVTRRERG